MAAISGALQRATAGAFELQVPFHIPQSSMHFLYVRLAARKHSAPCIVSEVGFHCSTGAACAKAKRVRRVSLSLRWQLPIPDLSCSLKIDPASSTLYVRSVLSKGRVTPLRAFATYLGAEGLAREMLDRPCADCKQHLLSSRNASPHERDLRRAFKVSAQKWDAGAGCQTTSPTKLCTFHASLIQKVL